MIYSVKGELIHTESNLAVVECGGVGYACRTTSYTLSPLKVGDKVLLYTYLSVREDAVELFGFGDLTELNCFKMLITVSGVGPKVAIAILSDLTPQALALAVVNGDSKALTRAQGIGNKIAQRIVLELKDKLAKDIDAFEAVEMPDAAIAKSAASNNMTEAATALVVLGFSSQQASKALEGADPTLPTSELVKEALKKLAQR